MGSFTGDVVQAGIVPLQDHDPEFNRKNNLQIRSVRFAHRIIGREGNERYIIEDKSDSDEVCTTIWRQYQDRRPTAAFAAAFPVVGVRGSAQRSDGSVATGSGVYTGYLPQHEAYKQDSRFGVITPAIPIVEGRSQRAWPSIPFGTFGMLVSTVMESKQVEVFLHGDPRMVAVNVGGEPHMGSLVCDLTGDHEYAADRQARLQSMMRVVLPDYVAPGVPDIPDDPDRPGQKLPSIAWNLTAGGRDRVWGYGLVIGVLNEASAAPPPVPTGV